MEDSSCPSSPTFESATPTEFSFPPPSADDDRPTSFSTAVEVEPRVSRPKIRARGVSLPAWRNAGDAAGQSASFFSEYLQALDLPIPAFPTALPPQLTYHGLRTSLLAHIGELEKRVRSYYDAQTSYGGGAGQDGERELRSELSAGGPEGEKGSRDEDSSTLQTRGHERTLSDLAYNATPELVLNHLASLRNDVLSHLPSLSSLSSFNLSPLEPPSPTSPTSPTGSQSEFITPPPPSSPLATFLSTLPRRLESLHQSLPKLPRPRSVSNLSSRSPSPNRSRHTPTSLSPFKPSLHSRFSSSATSLASRAQAHLHLPSLSLASDTKLGLGAKHIFDLLDTLVPNDDANDRFGDGAEDGLMFPVWPNRTPRHWDPSFSADGEHTAPLEDDDKTAHSSLESSSSPSSAAAEVEGTPAEKELLSETLGSADGEVLEKETKSTKGNRPRKPSLTGPTVEEAIKKARLSSTSGNLLTYSDLPGLWQNNEFIITGYRFIPIEDWQKLVRSLFQLHNETFNIHSHLISSIVVLLSIPIAIWNSPYTLFAPSSVSPNQYIPATPSTFLATLVSYIPNPLASSPLHTITVGPSPLDTAIMCIFLLAAFKCLFCSALWHLFAGCATKRYFLTFACVDYLGIAWLIAASVNTVVYFGFYCNPAPMTVYMLLNLGVAIAGSVLPFQNFFNERKNKHLRIAFFVSMACSAIAPMLHMALLHGFSRTRTFLFPMTPMIFSYFFGLWFYARHFPESRWPGKFDHFGASHNIWHSSICVAIACHFVGVLKMYNARMGYSCG